MLKPSHIMDRCHRVFGQGWESDEAHKAFIFKMAKDFVTRLGKISPETSKKQFNGRADHLLKSFNAKFCSLIMAWPDDTAPVTFEELEATAKQLSPIKPINEKIKVVGILKENGKLRHILMFGPKRRAMQYLCLQVLKVRLGESPYEYARKGRGRDKALLAAIKAIKMKGGPRHFITTDIKECFPSFNREAIMKLLPLRNDVVKNCLLIPNDALLEIANASISENAVRSGIPTGSLASPYIASKLLEPVLQQFGDHVWSHVDDIMIGCKTAEETQAKMKTLVMLLDQHPAGPLFMKEMNYAPLGKIIDFLGYRLVRRWKQFGGGARTYPSQKSFQKMRVRLTSRLEYVDLNDPANEYFSFDDFRAVADGYLNDWINSYGAWDNRKIGLDFIMADTADVVSGIWQEKKKASVKPKSSYHSSDEHSPPF